MNIYDIRRYGKLIFLLMTLLVVGVFLHISSDLVDDLAAQERERMEIWADATKQIANISMAADGSLDNSGDIDFLLSIIRRNHTIPVLLTDNDGNILDHRNFDLPLPVDTLNTFSLAPENEAFLKDRLATLREGSNEITISISPTEVQHLYYEDSKLLKRLSLFPYLQLLVMIAFMVVVYFAVLSTKKAEQNKVWVGLSKETAHQLGTPISSLMAWMELLESLGVEADTVAEMNKDVTRLSTIASRFSKIGSKPAMELTDLNDTVGRAAAYMSTRISSRISLTTSLAPRPLEVNLCPPLFEWVMENLIKNAVDAMEGTGSITITTAADQSGITVDVADTGKGIPRKHQKTIFNPGYTTKKRGWGLGLTLAKRIIEQYHRGRIFVLRSEPSRGTTFRIVIPHAAR